MGTLSFSFLPPFLNGGQLLKEKKFAPPGSNFFPFRPLFGRKQTGSHLIHYFFILEFRNMPYFLMDGWMTCDFMSFLTVFQSYQDDVWMIMKGCVQWNSVCGWEDITSSEDRTRSARSVGQRLTHWATGDPHIFWRGAILLVWNKDSDQPIQTHCQSNIWCNTPPFYKA